MNIFNNVESVTKQIKISPENEARIKKNITNIIELKENIETSLGRETTETLESLMLGSVALEASDIHIEPEKEQTKIRIRLDGILQDVVAIPQKSYAALLSRIKLLSELKFNVIDRPQDGRFSLLLPDLPIEIRVSTIPAENGESVVMRILNPQKLIDLSDLGLREDLYKIFEKEIKKPNGMIIVTGPTGSGKTTTLYAFLKKIRNPEIKIITIEDPIEYHLDGISQTQTSPETGYTFASGLKSIMRQDPDVILVGEIRDLETAQIGLQASLTGHLVLSTLHTNDAAGTIPRLIDLGASPSSIAPAINMAVAQRLIRRVCKKCSKIVNAPNEDAEKIKKAVTKLPKNIKMPDIKKGIKIAQIKGCKLCNFTGYSGRVGIFEAFLVDNDLEKIILTSPSVVDLKELAGKKGMITMYQDGIIKALEGKTTIDEVERATGE